MPAPRLSLSYFFGWVCAKETTPLKHYIYLLPPYPLDCSLWPAFFRFLLNFAPVVCACLHSYNLFPVVVTLPLLPSLSLPLFLSALSSSVYSYCCLCSCRHLINLTCSEFICPRHCCRFFVQFLLLLLHLLLALLLVTASSHTLAQANLLQFFVATSIADMPCMKNDTNLVTARRQVKQ